VVIGASYTAGNATYQAFRWTSGAGMINLGTLGGTNALASGVSADGSVVVGNSDVAAGGFHAFRWTGGVMSDLGTLGGLNSYGSGVSADGSVVVGSSQFAGGGALYHAYRWTGGVMTDLGTLGGSSSSALATSADGSVVVGSSSTAGNAAFQAFRWTSGAGMVNLGTLGGTNSQANGLSADGLVVVGSSDIAGGGFHPFRWTGGVMTDLGSLGGNSSAYGVSADGSVVVGYSQIGVGAPNHAFRWTAGSGMMDLNTLLTNAGVNMNGITLKDAYAVSSNGKFVGGDADFSGQAHAYVLRYDDGTVASGGGGGAVIAGITTSDAVQQSVNDLSSSRFGLMAQEHGMAAPLLGANTPMSLSSEAGVFAAAGSAEGGAFARYNTGTGVSLLGGLSWGQESYPSADLHNSFLAAGAAQYVYAGNTWWHPFVEGGGWVAPNSSFSFTRIYANGAGTAIGIGNTSGDLSYVYGRGGLMLAWDNARQIAASAELGRERLGVNGYAETLLGNPFNATESGGTDRMDVAKLRLQGSWRFADRYDATLWVAGVHGFNRATDLVTTVVGLGALAVTDLHALNWAEYGARLGIRVTESTTLDVFGNGVSGAAGVGTRVHIGAGARVRF
jgi:probable HAF family extracellular repeat protein